MMPISMTIGIIFYNTLSALSFLTPALIFAMLFINYCNISLNEIKITRLHFILVSIQVFGSIIAYLALVPFSSLIAEGTLICILAPTATSAIVITGMLGGNTKSLVSFSLLSNLSVVIVAPVVFAAIGDSPDSSILQSAFSIFLRIFIMLLLPFILSLLIKKLIPTVHGFIRKKQSFSFYLWNVALIIVTAKTVLFILNQDAKNYHIELLIVLSSLFVCVLQFVLGKAFGKRYQDTIAGGQGLGQKNTVLAIWMSQTYLNPISSIGAGAYVLWQNIINSYQVWKRKKN
ncbi:MAG: transporter [Dysgonomonas sp.]